MYLPFYEGNVVKVDTWEIVECSLKSFMRIHQDHTIFHHAASMSGTYSKSAVGQATARAGGLEWRQAGRRETGEGRLLILAGGRFGQVCLCIIYSTLKSAAAAN